MQGQDVGMESGRDPKLCRSVVEAPHSYTAMTLKGRQAPRPHAHAAIENRRRRAASLALILVSQND
eukprot:2346061-Pleurochrysis_carterae.AAC.2